MIKYKATLKIINMMTLSILKKMDNEAKCNVNEKEKCK